MCEGRGRDQQIVRADRMARSPDTFRELGMYARDIEVEGQDGQTVDYRPEERHALHAPGFSVGAMYAGQELRSCDGGQANEVVGREHSQEIL